MLNVVEVVVSNVFIVARVVVIMCLGDTHLVLVLLLDNLQDILYFYLPTSIFPLFYYSVIPFFTVNESLESVPYLCTPNIYRQDVKT